jgi:hypothetical protein
VLAASTFPEQQLHLRVFRLRPHRQPWRVQNLDVLEVCWFSRRGIRSGQSSRPKSQVVLSKTYSLHSLRETARHERKNHAAFG